jgi:hypothetical protein
MATISVDAVGHIGSFMIDGGNRSAAAAYTANDCAAAGGNS